MKKTIVKKNAFVNVDGKKYLNINIEEVEKWKESQTIVINCPTGSGKSYFAKNSLIPFLQQENKSCLFLAHRSLVVDQFESDIQSEFDTINNVVFCPYQSLQTLNIRYDVNEFDYIVCDEYDYWTNDSGFNHETQASFLRIMNSRATKIMMSATAGNYSEDNEGKILTHIKKRFGIDYYYEIKNNYKNIKSISIYSSDEALQSILNKVIKQKSKALVFCSSIQKALELHMSKQQISKFICAKSNKEYKYVDVNFVKELLGDKKLGIRGTNRFNDNDTFIFTTKLLDAGIDIIDENVKHIIIDGIRSLETIEQMVGRVRSQPVHVHIREVKSNHLNTVLFGTNGDNPIGNKRNDGLYAQKRYAETFKSEGLAGLRRLANSDQVVDENQLIYTVSNSLLTNHSSNNLILEIENKAYDSSVVLNEFKYIDILNSIHLAHSVLNENKKHKEYENEVNLRNKTKTKLTYVGWATILQKHFFVDGRRKIKVYEVKKKMKKIENTKLRMLTFLESLNGVELLAKDPKRKKLIEKFKCIEDAGVAVNAESIDKLLRLEYGYTLSHKSRITSGENKGKRYWKIIKVEESSNINPST